MKIQYFCSDLSHILKIGEISEMHIDTVNGRQVLRIECAELVEDEYTTIKAGRKYPVQKKTVKPEKVVKPESTLVKIAKGAQGYLKGKQNDTNWVDKFSKGPNW